MYLKESKFFIFFCALAFFFSPNDATEIQSKVFHIKSSSTMQRKFKNELTNELSENAKSSTSLDDIINSYLYATNENENIKNQTSESIFQNEKLDDIYVGSSNNYMVLQNVTFVNSKDFLSTPINVKMEIKEISNHHIVQVNFSTGTTTMLFTCYLISQDKNYTINITITNPVFQINEQVRKEKSNSALMKKEQTEIFNYDGFLFSMYPKDLFFIMLNKTELKSNILLRLADTWLPPIADWLKNNFMMPKIQEYEKLLKENAKKLFVRRICDFIKQQSNLTVENMTKLEISSNNWVEFSSIVIENIGVFTRCNGDSLIVKNYFNSSQDYNFRHNLSISLNYDQNNTRILATQTDSIYQITGYQEWYWLPLSSKLLSDSFIAKVDLNICFDVRKSQIGIAEVINSDISWNVLQKNTVNSESQYSKILQNHVLKSLNSRLLKKLRNGES